MTIPIRGPTLLAYRAFVAYFEILQHIEGARWTLYRTRVKNGVKIDTFWSCRALWRSVTHFRARGQGRKRTFHFILWGWGVLLLEKHYLGCLQLKRMVPWGISDVYFSGDKKFRIIFWIIRIILFQEFFNFVPNDGLLLLFWCTRLSLLKYFNKRLF